MADPTTTPAMVPIIEPATVPPIPMPPAEGPTRERVLQRAGIPHLRAGGRPGQVRRFGRGARLGRRDGREVLQHLVALLGRQLGEGLGVDRFELLRWCGPQEVAVPSDRPLVLGRPRSWRGRTIRTPGRPRPLGVLGYWPPAGGVRPSSRSRKPIVHLLVSRGLRPRDRLSSQRCHGGAGFPDATDDAGSAAACPNAVTGDLTCVGNTMQS